MNTTELLAQYVCNTKFEDFPPEVIEKAKWIVKDYFGCAIGGYATGVGRAAIRQVCDMGGAAEATVIGTNHKVPAACAAFANATLSNILDFDDTYTGSSHPGNTIVSAAVAVAEKVQATGKDFLTAVIVGYEVALRVGNATRLSKDKVQRLWPGTSWQGTGAIAAASKLLKLDHQQTINAFGLACGVAPVPLAVPKFSHSSLGWFKNGFAWTTFTGVFWSIFAESGIAGITNVFDDPGGFWEIIGSDRYFKDEMVSGLGEKYLILDVDFKPFPSCRWTHTGITAVSELTVDNNIEADQVQEVLIRSIARIGGFMQYPPMTYGDVSFCFPYQIALALKRVTPGPAWFNLELMKEPSCIVLQEKIKFSVHPEADRLFEESGGSMLVCSVEIVMKDGTIHSKSLDYAKGSPQYPMSGDEWLSKYTTLTNGVISKEAAYRLLEWTQNLENIYEFGLPGLLQ